MLYIEVDVPFFFTEEITSAIKQRGCASNPCAHNAQCKDRSNGEFQCICPTAFTGMFCEISVIKHGKELRLNFTFFDLSAIYAGPSFFFKLCAIVDIEIPAFSSQSFIQLKPLKAYQKFSVEIEFKSYTENGILLYSQQREDGAGDFLSLAIINGY